jgi:hypothetical protein
VTKARAERKERQYESKGSKRQIELGQSDRNKRGIKNGAQIEMARGITNDETRLIQQDEKKV